MLLKRLGAERYAEALATHRQVLRDAFARHGGYEVDEEGDAFLVAFPAAGEAIAAAREAQQGLSSVAWPCEGGLLVRMGVHTGEPLPVPPKYVGMDVHRAARIMAAGHGSQVLVSETTAALLDGVALRDLGPQRLKDMLEPIRLYQLEVDVLPGEFPPLRSLHQTNLPVAAWPLIGRERELEEIRTLVAGNARLVTLTGAGGSGKTRLALQAAAELSDQFADGVFFVGLAPLRATDAVRAVVAEAVGLQADEDVVAWLRSRRVLLVLDNLEHLAAVETVVAGLLVGEVVVLATSRAPLHLSAERELRVEPLPGEAAVELFVSRAAVAGRRVEADETVAEVCRRLDNLPLALELAAAKSRLLAPSVLLQRLDAALPLLTGGAHDLPERQQTLRATIEWSHELLDVDSKAAFQHLSVFRGSFTLDAAENVAATDLDQMATLLDQSLIKPLGADRFFLLETLREFAGERLDASGETEAYALRHARHYLERLENAIALGPSRRAELLAWFVSEEDNLRAMLDSLEESAPDEAAQAAYLLSRPWFGRGSHSEARQRFRSLLGRPDLRDDSRAMLLERLSDVEERLGHLGAGRAAAEEAAALAAATDNRQVLVDALRGLAWNAFRRGENEEAIETARRAAEAAAGLDEETQLLAAHELGSILLDAGRLEEGRIELRKAAEQAHQAGNVGVQAASMVNLGLADLYDGDYESALSACTNALQLARTFALHSVESFSLLGLGFASLGLGRRHEARGYFSELLELVLAADQTEHTNFASAASGIALAAEQRAAASAARLRGAVQQLRRQREFLVSPQDDKLERHFEQPLVDALATEAWQREQATGATLTLDETIALARTLARAEVPTD